MLLVRTMLLLLSLADLCFVFVYIARLRDLPLSLLISLSFAAVFVPHRPSAQPLNVREARVSIKREVKFNLNI